VILLFALFVTGSLYAHHRNGLRVPIGVTGWAACWQRCHVGGSR